MNLRPIAANTTEIDLGAVGKVLFSYQTPVAAMIDEGLGYVFYRTDKFWSATTSRRINKWLGVYEQVTGEKPQEFFDALVKGA